MWGQLDPCMAAHGCGCLAMQRKKDKKVKRESAD